MGRARHDGYRVDSAHSAPAPSSTPTSTPTSTTRPATSSQRQDQHGSRRTRERSYRNRRARRSACNNPQVRKGVGACIFVLGIPCLIAGLIFTIVSSTDDGDEESGRKYPTAFPVVGPILLVLSVLCFGIGVLLHNIAILVAIRDCLNLSEPGSFCRVHFPKLSAWLRPDPTVARNRAALNNLQTAPARSAMRKARNPDLVAVETETLEGQGHLDGSNPNSKRKRGVTFSHSDDPDGGHGYRLDSSASETERVSLQSDTGAGGSTNGHSPSSSLLSLRHCKIHPKDKDDVFWTDSSGSAVGTGADGGGGDGLGGGAGHPGATDINGTQGAGAGQGGEGEAVSGRIMLSDIDEENTSDAPA